MSAFLEQNPVNISLKEKLRRHGIKCCHPNKVNPEGFSFYAMPLPERGSQRRSKVGEKHNFGRWEKFTSKGRWAMEQPLQRGGGIPLFRTSLKQLDKILENVFKDKPALAEKRAGCSSSSRRGAEAPLAAGATPGWGRPTAPHAPAGRLPALPRAHGCAGNSSLGKESLHNLALPFGSEPPP